MGCKREGVLLMTDKVCVGNIRSAVESLLDGRMVSVFVVALLLIGILSWIANRSPRSRPIANDNVNYQLQNINNRLDRMGR